MKIFKVKDEGNWVEVGAVSKRDLEENIPNIPNMDLDIEFRKIKIKKSENKVAWFDKCDDDVERVILSDGSNLAYWTIGFENSLKKSDLELK